MSRRATPRGDGLSRGALVATDLGDFRAEGTVVSLGADRAGVRWARTGITTSVPRRTLSLLPPGHVLDDLLPEYRQEAPDADA